MPARESGSMPSSSAFVQPMLQRADSAGLPAYIEVSSELVRPPSRGVWVGRGARVVGVVLATLLVMAGFQPVAGAVPTPGSAGGLNGDFCISANDCFAVGQATNRKGVGVNEALRWNGMMWALTATPRPNADSTTLNGITCVSASGCFAVGYYFNNTAATLNEALRWNGTEWSLIGTPDPGGTASLRHQNQLKGVACVSVSDCFAAGNYTGTAGATLNEVLRWNGTKWSLMPTPDPSGTTGKGVDNELNGISCVSASDCFAVGQYVNRMGASVNEALGWNGTKWSLIPTPDPSGTSHGSDVNWLNGVACASAKRCSAVGYSGGRNEALRWNGTRWSLTPTPDPSGSGNFLLGVACASGDCVAVGWYYHRTGELNEALRWHAKRWSLTSTPDPSGTPNASNSLTGVACSSSTECFAVGTYFKDTAGTFVNQILRWNGTNWSKG